MGMGMWDGEGDSDADGDAEGHVVTARHQRSPRKFWLAAACCGMLRHASSCWSRVPSVV